MERIVEGMGEGGEVGPASLHATCHNPQKIRTSQIMSKGKESCSFRAETPWSLITEKRNQRLEKLAL